MPRGKLSVVFDLDGTLTDSRPGFENCLKRALKAQAIQWGGPIEHLIGPPVGEWKEMLGLAIESWVRLVRDYRVCYDKEGWMRNTVYPGIPELLCALSQYRADLFVCTSKQQYAAERILEKFGLASHFKMIYGDRPDLVNHSKSELLTSLMREQKLNPGKTWMVGDRRFDIEAAHANNVCAIGVTYGYGCMDELFAANPTALCHTPTEILPVLTRND
jgi:phosphoglycolate phosphatase